jgi:hypothetical protein
MAKYERGNDATAARKLAHSDPLSSRNARADETPRRSSIERLKPGSDPSRAIAELYAYGRKLYGRNPDARRDERTPQYRTTSAPSHDAANYDLGESSPMDPARNEYGPQFDTDKKSDRIDTKEAWCRGMAKEPHPFFDHSPARGKERR